MSKYRGLKLVFLPVADLGTNEWRRLDPALKGLELMLHYYCATQENHGRIAGAKTWSSSEWTMTLGKGGTRKAIDALVEAGRCAWDDDELAVLYYDVESEAGYKRKRDGGVRSAEIRAAKKLAEKEKELAEALAAGGDGSNIPANTPANIPARLPVKQSRAEAGRGGLGEAGHGLPTSGPEGLSSGTGTGTPRSGEPYPELEDCAAADGSPVRPIDLIRYFEKVYLDRNELSYATSPADQTEAQKLVDQNLADRVTLFADVDAYVAMHSEDASLSGCSAWIAQGSERQGEPSARTRAS